MGSNNNSINPYSGATPDDIQRSLGITEFSGANGDGWTQVIGGLIIQGGQVGPVAGNTLSANLPFNVAFPKQVLGVFITAIDTVVAGTGIRYSFAASVVDLVNFKIANDGATAKTFYWWALGI